MATLGSTTNTTDLGGGGASFARKAADTARSTETVSADPDLTRPVVASGVYALTAWLRYSATAAADFRIGWTIPTGAAGNYGMLAPTDQISTNTADGFWRSYSLATPLFMGAIDSAGTPLAMSAMLSGLVTVGATAGDVAVAWARGNASATAATLMADSWFKIERVA